MPEVWAAAIGAVTAIAGTVYSINAQNNAIEAANSAHPRAFVPINIDRTAALGKAADIVGYQVSDTDFAKRFPQLVKGRAFNIENAGNQLGGGTSPQLKESMDKAGLSADLGTDEFQKARSLGKPILGMEQRDRNYFQRVLGENPQRQAGLSGADVTKLAAANTSAQGAYNSQIFGNKVNAYNASVAQGISNTNAAVGGLAGLGGLVTDYMNRPPAQSGALDPNFYYRLPGSHMVGNPATGTTYPGTTG